MGLLLGIFPPPRSADVICKWSPRNSSLVHDLSDPVTVHVNTAEAILRRGIRSHANLPVITNLVEFNYIENKTLETQFMVSS